MKSYYIVGVIALVLLLAISGCQNAGEVVEEEVTGEATKESGGSEVSEEQEEIDVKDLIKELSEEAGLETEEDEDEADEEEATSGETTIVMYKFQGTPEDLDIKVGTTVTFVNEEDNFMHIVGVRVWAGSKYSLQPVAGYHELLPGESYSYTFNETGKYQWLSKTKYPDVSGEIEVTE